MNYYLVNSSWNWADEIDFSGFNLFNEDKFNKIKSYLEKLVKDGDESRNGGIGSNEDQDIRPSEVLSDFNSAIKISEEECQILARANTGKTQFDIFMEDEDFDKIEGWTDD